MEIRNSYSDKDTETGHTTAWEKDYCQITIQRDELLRLIHTNTLQDAVIYLCHCLQEKYKKSSQNETEFKNKTSGIRE